MNRYELEKQISRIVENNCEEIPYEGTYVHKLSMTEEIVEFILNKYNIENKPPYDGRGLNSLDAHLS